MVYDRGAYSKEGGRGGVITDFPLYMTGVLVTLVTAKPFENYF